MTSDTQDTPKKRQKFSEWSPKFIDALRDMGVVSYAADVAGIERKTAYRAKDRNGRFAAEWDEALGIATERLEAEARRRAYKGVDKPVTYQGQITATFKEYSDTLLIFLLKAHDPKYKDRVQIQSWKDDVVSALVDGRLSPEDVRLAYQDQPDLIKEFLNRANVSSD